ncbi:hypothetical protein FLA105534_04623 [Flavobacterium bizetiae]|uniref:NACHT domain-containing protein n=1 Tax=Flavobacterium bizetiae TaxID=2704140 RepID=A0A6J4H118_9FLAO|nr:hypothetical protein [Flavobacterium bizetiae]CAA9203423.1 hypothetical protein FLA105534_04623 [Flavobacterium bizetiae]CAD5342389.1 hypothetical protein FLA105535_02375 [Flavobacterium bizetiae]CAD5348305.1 hypothetical protein FLA105534_02266 [Flavobacterium bizetiae]
MAEIKREAGDKTKGFTLQKQRALGLFFDEFKNNPNACINVAIEYKGDVFLQNDDSKYIEEEKNYDDTTAFSFNSSQILNTLVYFLEIWISSSKSTNLKFGFYSTNKITVENNTKKTTLLDITLPKQGLLKLVFEGKLQNDHVLDSVRKYLVAEYLEQYDKNIEQELDDDSLAAFLSAINWYFEQDNEKDYKEEIIIKIKDSKFAESFTNPYQKEFVYAALMLALEEKQDEADTILKFLRKDGIENFFLKICAGKEINLKAQKYLNVDISDLKIKVETWLQTFLHNKYFSNIKDKSFPELIDRKVAKHNREIKIARKNIEQTDPAKAKLLDVVIKNLGDLINDSQPTFLFGEIGSGKSTLLAHYFLKEVKNDVLPIFIPSSYLRGKIPTDKKVLKSIINEFVNEELNIIDKIFDIDFILLAKKEVTLIFDGLDEFDFDERKKLLSHLLNWSNSAVNIRIIASGRPIEMSDLVHFNQWNCLTTLDLSENEIKLILKNEAVGVGMSVKEAEDDSVQRWNILKSKQELLANASTPLIVCLIRDFLDENLNSKTLGDILYEVVKIRLKWTSIDQKESFKLFLDTYPNVLQRESFIASIAYRLYTSKDGKINDDVFYQIIDSLISTEVGERNKLVDETINFIKSNFLQKTGEQYAFQSHQLLQLVVGLYLFKGILKGEDFNFKNERINSWREISFASAIARTKGESAKVESYLSEVIEELLFTSNNTPAAAVLLAEAQISSLNTIFLDKVKLIGFRPLMFWGQSDSLVPQAYAYIIDDLKEDGFDWFFNDYITPRHSTFSGNDEMAALILRYYLLRSQFELKEREKTMLASIIPYHLAAQTFTCHELLPTMSLAIPKKFTVEKGCILLAEALKIDLLKERAAELLKEELNKGNREAVVKALEIACRSKDRDRINAIKMWFEIVEGDIPKVILDNCINLIANEENELFLLLQARMGESRLQAYCRFNAISNNSISDAAAVVLFKYYGERNPILVGEPVLKKPSWSDYKNGQREKIVEEIICDSEKGVEYIIRFVDHSDDKSGIPDLYLKYFLATLEKSENIYLNEFLFIVRNLSKYSLARYPEIRAKFSAVLTDTDYYDVLKSSLKHLDGRLRYKAATILLISNPEYEKEALEIVIRSVSKSHHDNQEFLRLCMKLNFSPNILDFIFSLTNELPELSKVFALKLLYHNNQHKLTKDLLTELIRGLLGDASFLDWSGNFLDDGIERVIGKEQFYLDILDELSSENLKNRTSAARSLLYHYADKLTIKEKAQCWLLDIQDAPEAIKDFYNKFQFLFDDPHFVRELKEFALLVEEKYSLKDLIFPAFYQAYKDGGDWKHFFLALVQSKRHFDNHVFQHLYGLIFQLGKLDRSTKQKIGVAVKEIMALETFAQDHSSNLLIPQLAIIAHEFNALNNFEINEILDKYRIADDNALCALLYRLGSIPETFNTNEKNIDHISLFARNTVIPFVAVNLDELDNLLVDGEDIPHSIITNIEAVLVQGDLTFKDLVNLSNKGNLGTYFSIAVNFSNNQTLDLSDFAKAENIGSRNYNARKITQENKAILSKIREISLSDDKQKNDYINLLINDIADPAKSKNVINLFTELFTLKADFDSELLPLLFESLMEFPYRFNLNLLFWINGFIIELDEEKQNKLVNPFTAFLKTINNYAIERHENKQELLSWCLSLILLLIEKKVNEDIERGILNGLKNIFIQDGQKYAVNEHSHLQFKGRDLFICSDVIIKKIDPSLFQQIIQKGAGSNVPEISSLCTMFSVFTMQ